MKTVFRTVLLMAAVLYLGSCAKTESESYYEKEQRSFDAWMQLNIIDKGIEVQRLDNGMYVEWLGRAEGDGDVPETGDWIRLNYRGESLQRDLFMTRYENDARRQGTFTYYTHYVPQYLIMNNYNGLTIGQNYILPQMKVGDSVRIYVPSTLGYQNYGTSFSNGYEGQYALSGNVPAIIEMVIKEVVPDPTAYENEEVKNYAVNKWGMEVGDTLKPNMYLEILEQGPADQDTINVDSTIYYKYTGRFLDGFIVDTNDSTAYKEKFHAEPTSALNALLYDNSSVIAAFQNAMAGSTEKNLKLRYGAKFRMIFTSTYGYGETGNIVANSSSSDYSDYYYYNYYYNNYYNNYYDYYYYGYSNPYYYYPFYSTSTSTTTEETDPYTVIQPYTPLIFEVEIMKKGYDPDED